jgi:hypothetical protein
LAEGREVRGANWEKIANANKWQAIKDGPLKVWEKGKQTDQNRADKFQELDTKPWKKKSKWLELEPLDKPVGHKHITWYSAKNPNGLRYEGDDEKKGKDSR